MYPNRTLIFYLVGQRAFQGTLQLQVQCRAGGPIVRADFVPVIFMMN